jgi:CheY-like chemotaxis protein
VVVPPEVTPFACGAAVSIERRACPRRQRVLAADDTDDIRSLWKLWLSFWGFDVVEARNGDEAIRKTAEAKPALILMDLWMPVLDGVAATQRLKRDPATDVHVSWGQTPRGVNNSRPWGQTPGS